MRIVDEREPGALSATVLCAEPEAGYLVFVGFVELGELSAKFILGYVGAVGVENITCVDMFVSQG